jgi:hypothetical protein
MDRELKVLFDDILLCLVAPICTAILLLSLAYGTARFTHNRFRFSLRTLLIVTTLLATVLGLIVAVMSWPAG